MRTSVASAVCVPHKQTAAPVFRCQHRMCYTPLISAGKFLNDMINVGCLLCSRSGCNELRCCLGLTNIFFQRKKPLGGREVGVWCGGRLTLVRLPGQMAAGCLLLGTSSCFSSWGWPDLCGLAVLLYCSRWTWGRFAVSAVPFLSCRSCPHFIA